MSSLGGLKWGHSLETACKFLEKVGTRKTVVDKSSQLRQHAAHREELPSNEASAEEEQGREEVTSVDIMSARKLFSMYQQSYLFIRGA